MNRYFFAAEERDASRRAALARIDEVAPAAPEAEGALHLSLDAVDGEWPGFAGDALLSLAPGDDDLRMARYWKSRFLEPPGDLVDRSPYDEVPLFQIVVELPTARCCAAFCATSLPGSTSS